MGPSGLFDNTTIPLLEQVVNFSQTRHNLLAGNIANLDTPGYRARDLSPVAFQARLKEALADRHQAPSAALPGALAAGRGDNLSRVGQDLPSMVRHDDNNVSIEQQVAELTKNQLQHNVALSIMASQFRLLQAAISEKP